MKPSNVWVLSFLLSLVPLPGSASDSPTVEVRARIDVVRDPAMKPPHHRSPGARVVLWLDPIDSQPRSAAPADTPARFRMEQKNKQFNPPFLVVPIGSLVEFPNRDTFFHNVFSQFNGKRFDLGLYEAGSTKGVRFDHEGVSYIFCNIHPEMAAVIITLATPYYSVSSGSGSVVLPPMPPGEYQMHIWVEGADIKRLNALTRRVSISPSGEDLGRISVVTSTSAPHKNKFGEDYRPEAPETYSNLPKPE
jgi:plastocyanin